MFYGLILAVVVVSLGSLAYPSVPRLGVTTWTNAIGADPHAMTLRYTYSSPRVDPPYSAWLGLDSVQFAALTLVFVLGFAGYLVATNAKRPHAARAKAKRHAEDDVVFLVRLEELRARGEMKEETYHKLREEYWDRILKESKHSRSDRDEN